MKKIPVNWLNQFHQIITRPKQEGLVFSLFCLYLGCMFLACTLVADTNNLRNTCATSLALTCLNYLSYRAGVSYRICSLLLTAIVYGFIAFVAQQRGGIYASIIAWALFAPTITMLQGRTVARKWFMVSVALISAFAILGWLHPEWQNNTEGPEQVWWSLTLEISGLVGLFLFIGLYEVLQQSRQTQIEKQTQTLEKTQFALKTAQSHKDKFIASISHELRTPMNAILGFSELLIAETKQPQPLQIIDYIQTSAKQLLRVINSILDYCQLLAGKLQLHTRQVELHHVIQQVVQSIEPLAHKKQLSFKLHIATDVPERIWVDPDRFALVLDHLLSNALKFTQTGSVCMHVHVVDAFLIIEVIDTGIGISQEQQALVFGRFHQASQEINRRYGGTGLGLAICEQITQLHGGHMGVNSTLGKGSTFWIKVPLNESALAVAHKNTYVQRQEALKQQNQTARTALQTTLRERLEHKLTQIVKVYDEKFPEFGGPNRVRAFLVFMYILIVLSPIFGAPYPNTPVSLIGFLLSPVLLLMTYLIYRGLSIRLGVYIILGYCTCHLTLMAIYTGGTYSPTIGWYAFVPLGSIYIFGVQRSVKVLLACIAVFTGIAWLTANNQLPTHADIPSHDWVWYVLNYISLTLLIPYLPLQYKRMHSATRKRMEEQNQELLVTQTALLHEQKKMDEFISSASHEFRTPMNAIMGFNELLEDHLKDIPDALEMHSHMTQSAKHLLTVIDDILDYSQLQKGHINIRRESFHLHQTCENAFRMFKPRIKHADIQYHLDMRQAPQWVKGDDHRLMQVLVNLLGNAVKFTDSGAIELHIASRDAGVVFEVKDTGIGIEPDRLSQLFQHFEQVHALQPGRYQGHGLGLAISKRLIEIQGGTIAVRSQPGAGTSFSVWLPYPTVTAPEEVAPISAEINAQDDRLNFLIVDDHPLNRLLVKQILQKTWPNAILTEAEDGVQALEKMQQQIFDVVLMDMVMPVMDGIEATHQIRQTLPKSKNQTPILGLTANVNPIDKQRCIDVGMNGVIYKPFKKDTLVQCISTILHTPEAKNGQALVA